MKHRHSAVGLAATLLLLTACGQAGSQIHTSSGFSHTTFLIGNGQYPHHAALRNTKCRCACKPGTFNGTTFAGAAVSSCANSS